MGEDQRTAGLSDDQMKADARFRGDGTGPRVDPRGRNVPANGSLLNIDPLGAPSPGGAGWASFYLDDNSLTDGSGMGTI